MSEVIVKIPRPHQAQKTILTDSSRFNVVCNGRRWGKTVLGTYLAIKTILEGDPIGYFVPTFDFGEEVWEELKDRLEDIIVYKNEAKFTMRFSTGGSIKIWSLEKKRSGRGRKYKRVIIDEAAFAKDLEESWKRSIRPTLTDLQGDAWFLSTPQGTNSFFYELFRNRDNAQFKNWRSWQMPSSTNPGLLKEELQEIKEQLDSLTFAQEFDAQFVNFSGKNFAYAYKREKHISESAAWNPDFITYLNFDFNVDPATCLVTQRGPNFIHWCDEFHLESSSIYDLLDQIKIYFPNAKKVGLRVNGDASGWKREGATRDLVNMYSIIETELQLYHNSIDAPIVNPHIKTSRVLLNSILERHPNFKIHPKCVKTIQDLELVKADDLGKIDKSQAALTHHLDTGRYDLSTYSSDFIKGIF